MKLHEEYYDLWQQELALRNELERILEEERKIHLRIAIHADRLHLQLQAIKEAALDDLCGLIADGPEDLNGLREVE